MYYNAYVTVLHHCVVYIFQQWEILLKHFIVRHALCYNKKTTSCYKIVCKFRTEWMLVKSLPKKRKLDISFVQTNVHISAMMCDSFLSAVTVCTLVLCSLHPICSGSFTLFVISFWVVTCV